MTQFAAWPGRRHVGYALLWIAFLNALFVLVYFVTDWITARRTTRLQLYMQPELAIPLWPWTILLYDSPYVLFALAPFVVRTRESFRILARSTAVTILVSGLFFLLLPAELGFAPAAVDGPFEAIFRTSDRINLDFNLVPSLHVALTMLCVQAFWPMASTPVRIALALWAAALAASTVLTHQHHLIDVAAGALLAAGAFRWAKRTADGH